MASDGEADNAGGGAGWLLASGLWLRYASRHLSPSITLRVLGHEGFCPAFAPLHLLSLPIFGHVGKL